MASGWHNLLIVLVVLCFPPFVRGQSIGLKQLYDSAISNTASLKAKKMDEEIAGETKSQAVASVLPSLSAESSTVWRDPANVGAFGEAQQTTSYLALSQPLFQGGAEYYALEYASNLPEIAKLNRQQEEINLYFVLGQLYFQVLQLQREKKTLIEQEKALAKRVSTLKKRVQIGRNKRTELLAVQAQFARLIASAAQLEGSLTLAYQRLSELSGMAISEKTLSESVIEKRTPPVAWQKEVQSSPLVKAYELNLENSKKQEGVASGEYFPTVDVTGRYYLQRAGILSESEWDVTLNATWNLFNGGNDSSEKRIANLKTQKLELGFRDMKRNLVSEYNAKLNEYKQIKTASVKLAEAAKIARENYRVHLREADKGLVSQLEVLRAFEDYLSAQITWDRQYYAANILWLKLQALAGIAP